MESNEYYENDLVILAKITKAVHKSSSLDEIYDVALDAVLERLNVNMMAIYLVDEEKPQA
ncbi:MAG: hypothetical protein IH874_08135 [Candidatus Dadabacteria bacterium]|nr:hypothetical protein [Candidatus Dadabacteria bacterium]